MILLDISLALLFVIGSLYFWKQSNDKSFLFVCIAAIVVFLIGVWAYFYEVLLHAASIATSILFVLAGWYHWVKLKDRIFLAVFVWGISSVITKTYDYYIEENILHLSDQAKLISVIVLWLSWTCRGRAIFSGALLATD